MKPDKLKRYDKYEASLNTNLADRYVLAADHERVVAELTASEQQWKNLWMYEVLNMSYRDRGKK